MKRTALILGLIATGLVIMTAAYAGLDKTGLRWVLLSEHRKLEVRVSEHETAVWIKLNDKRLSGKQLTPIDFDRWCTIGLRLGIIKPGTSIQGRTCA